MTILYTKPGCGQCARTKKMLENAGVEFDLVDITEEPESREQLVSEGYSALPVVKGCTGEWSGFRPDRIKELIHAEDS